MDEWMKEMDDEQMDEWMKGMDDEQMEEWMDEWKKGMGNGGVDG